MPRRTRQAEAVEEMGLGAEASRVETPAARAAQPSLLAVEQAVPRVTRVKLADIQLADENRALTDLLAPIRAVGLINPVTLIKHGTQYRVLAGRRRVAALKQIAQEDGTPEDSVQVDARVYAGLSVSEQASITLRENANRSDNVISELDAINKLLAGGMDEESIAGHLGVSQSWVARRRSLNPLSEAIKQAVARGHCTQGTALMITKLPPTAQAELARGYTANGTHISRRMVEERSVTGPAQTDALFETAPLVPATLRVRVERVLQMLRPLQTVARAEERHALAEVLGSVSERIAEALREDGDAE